jgi:hypothetical protein
MAKKTLVKDFALYDQRPFVELGEKRQPLALA